ncbi:hypothetical protein EV175_002125 [Coemansia sp. RSA 1933]|nr:hypothetical protein EV175_002125 [Coemansia sp. RSA 1933]
MSGNRLEFLIIENCGVTIDQYAKLRKLDPRKQGLVEQEVLDVVKQSSACIANAYAAEVLHRDISASNNTIKSGVAKAIDWGYSKIRDDMEIEGIGAVERRWRIKKDEVSEEESRHDSITGTPMFMSIQVLLDATSRDLIHDAESLFYVALYALAVYNGTIGADDQAKLLPLGFCNVDN